MRFGKWWRRNDELDKAEAFDAVIFPIKNAASELVAAQARAIDGDSKITRGEKSAGVFWATPGALDAGVLAVAEAPIDALTLAACGLDAIALVGDSIPEWLFDELVGRLILPATDADAAGDQCTIKLVSPLLGRATALRIRPEGVKDWSELAELEGIGSVKAQIDAVYDIESRSVRFATENQTGQLHPQPELAAIVAPVADDENLTPPGRECPF